MLHLHGAVNGKPGRAQRRKANVEQGRPPPNGQLYAVARAFTLGSLPGGSADACCGVLMQRGRHRYRERRCDDRGSDSKRAEPAHPFGRSRDNRGLRQKRKATLLMQRDCGKPIWPMRASKGLAVSSSGFEQSYDGAYQRIAGSQSSACSGIDAAAVKAGLQRYAPGYFAPRTPQPKRFSM